MNKTAYIPLIIPCPHQCVCRGQKIRIQTHSSCQTQYYINDKGDVVCQNYLNGKGCQQTFIQNFNFQCEEAKKSSTSYQFQKVSDFLLAFTICIQQAKCFKSDQEAQNFITNTIQSVSKRWQH